jgi:hypothetical protein
VRTSIRLSVVALVLGALLAALTPAQAAMTVRALWNMDKLPTMVDSVGGDNNGTTKNITVASGAYKFNGTSSAATAPDKANLDPGTAPVRLTSRVSITAVPKLGQSYDILRKGTDTTSGGSYKMEIIRSSTGQAIASCRFKSGSTDVRVNGTAALQGKGFVTITCAKNATTISLNAGGATTTRARSLGSISNSAAVYVGHKGDGTDYFLGLMDYVKIEIG